MITEILEKKNNKRINTIADIINDLLTIREGKKNDEISTDLLHQISKLDYRFKENNDEILYPLHLYLNVLSFKVRYEIDITVHNEELDKYTEYLLNNKQFLTTVFSTDKFQKVCKFLLVANLNIHNLDGYERLLDKYYDIFSYSYRLSMFTLLLSLPCGKMSLNKFIMPLFQNIEAEYSKLPVEGKCNLISDLLNLASKLDLSEEESNITSYIKRLHVSLLGKNNHSIVHLYEQLFYFGRTEICWEWVRSIDIDACQGTLKERCNLLLSKLNDKIIKADSVPFAKKNDYTDKYYAFIHKSNDIRQSKKQLFEDAREALQYYLEQSRLTTDINQKYTCNVYYYTLLSQVRELRFWALFEEAVQGHENNEKDDCEGVVFFVNDWSLVNASICLPLLIAAEARGFTFIPTNGRMCQVPHYKDTFLDDIAGQFMADHDARFEQIEYPPDYYEIDIPNKRVMVDGMNIYQPLYEFVARYQFSYFFNYESDAWVRLQIHKLLQRYIRLFKYIKEIECWAKKNDKKVYFISHAPHLQNASAFRIYCEEADTDLLNYICASAGYDNYFKNIGDAKTETISALNLTHNINSRNSFLGTKEGFESYYQHSLNIIDDMRQKADHFLTVNRRVKDLSPELEKEKNAVLKKVLSWKNDNKTVILLNGKVIFDLAVKYTEGCVHDDMSAWITHAVDFVKANPDLLLLIKPHPHEEREDLTLSPNKNHLLRSIIMTELGDNTIYLNNQLFTNFELAPYVDLGMVWNGTSALEFAAQDIPVLVGDEWGHLDYPIGFVKPKSLEEYESYMKEPAKIPTPNDLKDKAIMFLSYMGSEDVRIENPFTKTTSLNFKQFESNIDIERIDEFFRNGNEKLEKLFDSVLN